MSLLADSDKIIETLDEMGCINEKEEYEKMIENSEPIVPNFFLTPHNSIAKKITTLAIENVTKHLEDSYLTKQHVDLLKSEFAKISSPSSLSGNSMSKIMTYSQYCQLRQFLPENLSQILSAKLFLEIGGNSLHTINAQELFRYLYMIPACISHYNRILTLDKTHSGYLTEQDLNTYVKESLPNFPYVEEATEQRYDYSNLFISYAVQRFLVVLDPLGIGRISINQMVKENIFLNFVLYGINEDRPNQFREELVQNLIDEYDDLDEEQDENLTAENLLNCSGIKFTKTFVQRVMEVLGKSKNDFGWFVRFRVAWDNLGTKWANTVFFDVMDIDGDDKITQFEVNYFYRDIEAYFQQTHPKEKLVPAESLLDEKLDMAGATKGEITREMFINSPSSEQIVKQLVDLKSYAKWESISL